MVTSSIIKHLLSDKNSLSNYINGNIPTFEDVKRRLFLLERKENRHVPDHYYRLNHQKSLESIRTLGELIRIGLYRLADEHLELRENRIFVKQLKQNKWQELVTYIPPLLLQMAFLHIKKPLVYSNTTELIEYCNKYIIPNAKYTALPYPYIPQIKEYIKEKRGWHDLHMHLNGSTEADSAWQNFLTEPDKVYNDLKKGMKEPLVKEQFEQETYLHSPLAFRNLLLCARSARMYLYKKLFHDSSSQIDWDNIKSTKDILNHILDSKEATSNPENPFINNSAYHPFAEIIYNGGGKPGYPMVIEGLMYILVLNYISKEQRESTASIFHFYLLILGLSNRLLVQQVHQFGFEQFQKLTVNELRENSERSYKNRFFQVHGNDQHNICFLEGRFSPKPTEVGNRVLIQAINKGWEALKEYIKEELQLTEEHAPKLKLIAHFIKKKEDNESEDIRHKNLRYEVWSKAKILALMKTNDPELMKDVVGIDAASSEFDAPPEVFASSFRYLRRKGFKYFTYHAGEDFFHIISGLRAMYEAVIFNDLGCGDRIGHATAAGISPKQWVRNVGKTIFIRQGNYMDDLLFTYHLILHKNNDSLKKNIPLLINKIQELSYLIYKKPYSLKTLEDAWAMRRFCPALLFSGSRDSALLNEVFDDKEWYDIEKEQIDLEQDERVEILRKYHCKKVREEYDKIIEIETEEFYSSSDLELLQLLVLELLHEKEIVIETLPSSNVRIGHHFNFDTYHLWNWLKWRKEGKAIPPIVVGTDDTGIFATNIYNEYANIYCNLIMSNKVSHNEAMRIIENLDKNGRIYKFE